MGATKYPAFLPENPLSSRKSCGPTRLGIPPPTAARGPQHQTSLSPFAFAGGLAPEGHCNPQANAFTPPTLRNGVGRPSRLTCAPVHLCAFIAGPVEQHNPRLVFNRTQQLPSRPLLRVFPRSHQCNFYFADTHRTQKNDGKNAVGTQGVCGGGVQVKS